MCVVPHDGIAYITYLNVTLSTQYYTNLGLPQEMVFSTCSVKAGYGFRLSSGCGLAPARKWLKISATHSSTSVESLWKK